MKYLTKIFILLFLLNLVFWFTSLSVPLKRYKGSEIFGKISLWTTLFDKTYFSCESAKNDNHNLHRFEFKKSGLNSYSVFETIYSSDGQKLPYYWIYNELKPINRGNLYTAYSSNSDIADVLIFLRDTSDNQNRTFIVNEISFFDNSSKQMKFICDKNLFEIF